MNDDLIRRKDVLDAFKQHWHLIDIVTAIKALPSAQLPSAQPDPTLYGYPIEHLEMIARVMAKENCTPEAVAQMLQNAGEIAKMVREMRGEEE